MALTFLLLCVRKEEQICGHSKDPAPYLQVQRALEKKRSEIEGDGVRMKKIENKY